MAGTVAQILYFTFSKLVFVLFNLYNTENKIAYH